MDLKIFDKYEAIKRKYILDSLGEANHDENFIDMELFANELISRGFGVVDVYDVIKELVKYLAENHPEKLVKNILHNVYDDIVFLCDEKDVKDFKTPRVGNIYWGID